MRIAKAREQAGVVECVGSMATALSNVDDISSCYRLVAARELCMLVECTIMVASSIHRQVNV